MSKFLQEFRSQLYKILTTSFTFLMLISDGSADTLVGTVTNEVTKEPVVGAEVLVLGVNLSAVTDTNGLYQIENLPQGSYDILFGATNYRQTVIKDFSTIGTFVNLENFSAQVQTGAVVLSWSVRQNSTIVGYNLYRGIRKKGSEIAGLIRVNSRLIAGESPFHYLDMDVRAPGNYEYQLMAVDPTGREAFFGKLTVEVHNEAHIPQRVDLYQNYPNPFNPSTQIAYDVSPTSSRSGFGEDVRLHVYNNRGQLVRTLVDKNQSPGYYVVTWSGNDDAGVPVANGPYFFRLQVGNITLTRTMSLVK